jgi:L-ribulose-5-phosphate 3-epimerase
MRIGLNRWTMPPEWSVQECLAAAKRAGFDSIELTVAEEGELSLRSSGSDVQRIYEAAGKIGIELSSLACGLGWRYPLTSNDPDVRERGLQVMLQSLRIARWLGVDTVLCVPGVVDRDTPYDAAYERALSGLRELAEEAATLRVAIGVENVWNRFLLSPLEMARFLDEVDSECVGAYFDVGNVLAFGYPHHWIRILGRRIRKVHVKDFKTGIGNIHGFCNLLEGDVPWQEVNDALTSIGYDGHVIAEVEGYKSQADLGLRHVAECLRTIFQASSV